MMTSNCAGDLDPTNVLFDKRIAASPQYLTSTELAHFLKLSEHTIRAWRKLRKITPKKFGRSVRWLLEEVLQELDKRSKFK